MHVLRDVLKQMQKNGVAIGHFNIADLVLLKAVFASAQELKVPVLVGASEVSASLWESVRLPLWCEVCARISIFQFFSTQIIRIPWRRLSKQRGAGLMPSSWTLPRCRSSKTCGKPKR